MLPKEMSIKFGVGIVRRSDVKQKSNASLETQSEEIRARAKIEGYHIVKIFVDDANSAYHKNVTKRKAMTDLLEMVLSEESHIEAVFFYEESRVSRKFYDFTLYIHDVIKKQKPHTKFFSTSKQGEWDPYDIGTIIDFATAARESINKSARAKDAQTSSLGRGERPGSHVPYGYKLVFSSDADGYVDPKSKGEQVIHQEQAQIVLFIFYLTSWGHSQQTIANVLNEVNIPSPHNKTWSSGTVDYILNNDQYLGHLPWNVRSHLNTSRKKQRGEYDLIYNHHQPIISTLLWNLAHQTIHLHKENSIRIIKTYYNEKNNTVQFELVPPKTEGSVRIISVEDEIIEELKKHKAAQEREIKRIGDAYYNEGFIFANSDRYPGYPMLIKTVANRMKRLLKIAGINQELTPHSFRHTHTSLLAEAGVGLEEIMDRLGHTEDETTRNIYYHVTEELKKEASHKFGKLMRSLH